MLSLEEMVKLVVVDTMVAATAMVKAKAMVALPKAKVRSRWR